MKNNASIDLKVLAAKNQMSMADIANKIGSTPQSLSKKLSRGSLRYNEMVYIADVLGYKVNFEPKH